MDRNTWTDWQARASQRQSAVQEAALLTEILQAPKNSRPALEKLAADKHALALFRCAALDQYVKLVLEKKKSKSFLKDVQTAANFLYGLTHVAEISEDVRFAAIQWLIQLETDYAGDVTKSGRRGKPILNPRWKQQLERDPSPRIRWLISLSKASV